MTRHCGEKGILTCLYRSVATDTEFHFLVSRLGDALAVCSARRNLLSAVVNAMFLWQRDRFFMQVRRGIRLAERPIATATTDRRMWHGYAAYQPKNLAMALTLCKVAYNYCLTGADGKTPAMRLGLAKEPIKLEDIVYFQPRPD